MPNRTCLLDRIKNENVNCDSIILLSVKILDNIYDCLNDTYLNSPFSFMEEDFYDAYHSLVEDYDNTHDNLLDFSELVLTIIINYKNNHHFDKIKQIYNILLNALSRMGYGYKYDSQKKCCVCFKKDIDAEIVASTQPKSVKDKIYNYLSIREGDVSSKREAMKSLVDDVESFCKNKGNIKEIDKTKQFYQCVRHTKDEPKKEFPFYYSDEEKWLDYIFQMIIDVLAFKDLSKRTQEIIKEENKLTENKR